MSEPYSHIAPDVREVMGSSPAERIAVAQADQWVDYQRLRAARLLEATVERR
jgi:hypothetical protein